MVIKVIIDRWAINTFVRIMTEAQRSFVWEEC